MSSPSVCFLVDEPGWAFDRWTKILASELQSFGINATRCYRMNSPQAFAEDIIYVCWWGDVELVAPRLTSKQFILCRITDMLTWNSNAPAEWQQRFQVTRSLVWTFVAASEEIRLALESYGIFNVVTIGDCVNTTIFSPNVHPRSPYSKPRVGWCGNPTALQWMGFDDIKGIGVLQTLTNNENVDFFLVTDLSVEQMPGWFRSIDIYVCASRAEGTPLSILEALASGNIVISTAVGIVPEIKSAGVFIFDGTATGLRLTLQEVLDKRKEWSDLAAANRAKAQSSWSASVIAQQFVDWLLGQRHHRLWGRS